MKFGNGGAINNSLELTVDAAATTNESPAIVASNSANGYSFLSNGTTPVTLFTGDINGSGIDEVIIFNADSVKHEYTLKYNNNGASLRTIIVISLFPGQSLIYQSSNGFSIVPTNAG